LERYVAPKRDPAIIEALDDYTARRVAEGGAPPVS
jgi:trimethylamine:corrinoid methyltransferase-like protein